VASGKESGDGGVVGVGRVLGEGPAEPRIGRPAPALPSSMCGRSEEGEGAGGWGRREEAEGRDGVEHRF
jgi:hypothetical protein